MTPIFFTEYKTKLFGVVFQNIECVEIQKFKDISNDEIILL